MIREKEMAERRQIWQAFFQLSESVDPESFLTQLKDSGMKVDRGQVYQTLSLLAEYGFADKNRHEDLGLIFYRSR